MLIGFFFTFSETGILDLLKYPVSRSKINPDAIEDIQDGLLYKKNFGSDGFFKGVSDEKRKAEIHISFQLFTDGVALFRSSKYSSWPVYLVVNELPPNCRYAMHSPKTYMLGTPSSSSPSSVASPSFNELGKKHKLQISP